jgi:hypothetical protein
MAAKCFFQPAFELAKEEPEVSAAITKKIAIAPA